MSIPAAPTGLLSRNVGNGSVELSWNNSVGATSYNIYMATAIGGPFYKANLAPITIPMARLPNIKFSLKVFFIVTAVNASGESAQSSLACDAVCSQGVTTLKFIGLDGDVIPAGAMFTAMVNGRLVSFIVTQKGVCQ